MARVICKYTKTGDLKFISHLDVLRMMQRAISRAKLPAKYSEGFNPHMRLSFGYPLSLGVESIGEYFELDLTENVNPNKIVNELNEVLPNKVKILSARYNESKDSLMTMCKYAEYLIDIESESIDIDCINKLLGKMTKDGIVYTKEKKGKSKNKIIKKEVNTKDFIHYANAKVVNDKKAKLEVVFKTTAKGSLKASDFINILTDNGIDVDYYTAMKVDSLDENFKPLIE